MAACGAKAKGKDVHIARKDLWDMGGSTGIFHHWSVCIDYDEKEGGYWYELANPPKCSAGGQWKVLDAGKKLIGVTGQAWECTGDNMKFCYQDNKKKQWTGDWDNGSWKDFKKFEPKKKTESEQHSKVGGQYWSSAEQATKSANGFVGKTTKSHKDIADWSDNWVKAHANYTFGRDDCQAYATDLINFLVDNPSNVPSRESVGSGLTAQAVGNFFSSLGEGAASTWKSWFG